MIESNTMVGTGTGIKVVCRQDELAQKLGVVSRAVSTRASVQILSGVLLRAEGGRLHLAATDMELSLRSSLDAQVEGDGAVVVPGRLLVELVRLLPESEVTIEHRLDESVVRITSGASASTLHTYAAEDFPRLPALDAVGTFTVERQSLLDTVAPSELRITGAAANAASSQRLAIAIASSVLSSHGWKRSRSFGDFASKSGSGKPAQSSSAVCRAIASAASTVCSSAGRDRSEVLAWPRRTRGRSPR